MAKMLIKGARIVTLESNFPTGKIGDILIDGDRIADIDEDIAVSDAEILDARDRIAMPGLIDAHVHLWQTGLRGIAADWTVPQYMRAMHRGLATAFEPSDVYVANLVGALSKLNAGVTTVVDWCHNNPTPDHTDAAIDGLEESGIRALFLHGSPKPDPKPGQKHFSEVPMPRGEVERLRKGRLGSDDRLVTMGLAILGPQYSSYEVTEQDLLLAKEFGLIASAHTGGAPIKIPGAFEALISLGLIDRSTNIVHANNFGADLVAALVDAGATFTVTADVEMQMGFGDPLTGKLREAGSRFSVGSDVEPAVSGDIFTNLRVTLNMQRNIDNQRLLARGEPLPEEATITCREALEWATINGAAMMRKSTAVGSLTVGKQADVILVRTDDLNIFPVHDAVKSLVTQATAANVDTVLVAGRIMKRHGRLLHADLPAQQARLLQSGRRVLTKLGLLETGPQHGQNSEIKNFANWMETTR